MRVPIRKRLAPGRTQKSLQIPIMRCSAVASLLAYFFSRRQARSRFYRALLAGISNALPLKATGLYRFYLQLITDFWGRILVRAMPRTITSSKSSDPEEQLRSFIEKFAPPHQAIIRAVRRKLRKRFPTATELVYDNYNFFVIGFGPNERPSDCIVTIAAAANGVGLCFVRGASLPDPEKVLLGSGKQTRFVRPPSANVLERPAVQTLLSVAAERAETPMPASGLGRLVIRSVSAKQRPRRKKPRKT